MESPTQETQYPASARWRWRWGTQDRTVGSELSDLARGAGTCGRRSACSTPEVGDLTSNTRRCRRRGSRNVGTGCASSVTETQTNERSVRHYGKAGLPALLVSAAAAWSRRFWLPAANCAGVVAPPVLEP